MVSFAAAYLIVWLGVVLYLVRLERRQRSLFRTVQSLQSQVQPTPEVSQKQHASHAA